MEARESGKGIDHVKFKIVVDIELEMSTASTHT